MIERVDLGLVEVGFFEEAGKCEGKRWWMEEM